MISLIIPIYNVEAYLRDCLDSVVQQTDPDLEIILVNDGSPDSSDNICREYAEKDPRIKYIEQKNQGLSGARNSGLRAATGEYIMFVDSDDVIPVNICEIARCQVQKYDLLIMDMMMFPQNGKPDLIRCNEDGKKAVDVSAMSRAEWVRAILSENAGVAGREVNTLCATAKVYRRAFLQQHDIWFSDTVKMGAEDVLFNLRLYAKEPQAAYYPVESYYYRQNEASIVHCYSPKLNELYSLYFEELQRILKEEHLWQDAQEEFLFQKANKLTQVMKQSIFHKDNPKTYREKKADFLVIMEGGMYPKELLGQAHKLGLFRRTVLQFALHRRYHLLSLWFAVRQAIVSVRDLVRKNPYRAKL